MNALDRLLDDAALFPPGEAPMPLAVAAHLARAATPDGALVGPFVCPATRLPELSAEVGARGPLDVAVVADEPFDADVPGLRVVAVETRRPDVVTAPPGTRLVVERPLSAPFDDLPDDAVAKLRTGGASASDVPDAATLAAALGRLVRAGRPFKLTAGLHRAVRNVDPVTGVEHHGFVNVLLAVARLSAGAEDEAATVALSRRDAGIATDLSGEALTGARRFFTSFGTCDVDTPVQDLRTLGLLERTPA